MIVVKYFHEEPAALELLAPDDAPDARVPAAPSSLEAFLSSTKYYRGYLTASDLQTGLTGATAIGETGAWTEPLRSILDLESVSINHGSGPRAGLLSEVLVGASEETVVVVGASAGDAPALPGEIRDHNQAVREILDSGAVLLRAEPAHDGVDWALYSAQPLANRVTAAFQQAALAAGPEAEAVMRFVIPQRMARGEHKFYFERYDLELFAAYRV